MKIISGFLVCICAMFSLKMQADPINVKPTGPIMGDGAIVGFYSNDPVVEFTSPDSWVLKPNGVSTRSIGDGKVEINIQLEPTYNFARARKSELERLGVFKVFLPIAINVSDAKIYLHEILGYLQAEFVPYTGNSQLAIYFRIVATLSQMDTIFKLSLNNLTFTGEVNFELTMDDFKTKSVAPMKVAIDPAEINPSYRSSKLFVRLVASDDGREWIPKTDEPYAEAKGIPYNMSCDGGEDCIFQHLKTGKYWLFAKRRESTDPSFVREWSNFCQNISINGLPPMRLPTILEVRNAAEQGIFKDVAHLRTTEETTMGSAEFTSCEYTPGSYGYRCSLSDATDQARSDWGKATSFFSACVSVD